MALKDAEAALVAAEVALRGVGLSEERAARLAPALDVKPGDTLAHAKLEAEDFVAEYPSLVSGGTSGPPQDGRSVSERGAEEAARRGWTPSAGGAARSSTTHAQKAGRQEAIRRGWVKP